MWAWIVVFSSLLVLQQAGNLFYDTPYTNGKHTHDLLPISDAWSPQSQVQKNHSTTADD